MILHQPLQLIVTCQCAVKDHQHLPVLIAEAHTAD
jgi:hypothetical protein